MTRPDTTRPEHDLIRPDKIRLDLTRLDLTGHDKTRFYNRRDIKMKTIGEISIDTKMIYDKLITLEVNEIITYEELSQIIGRGCRPGENGYNNLRSAERKAMNDGIVMGAVLKIGRKRLDDRGMVDDSAYYIRKSRRASRTGLRRLLAVKDYANLDTTRQIKHNAHLSLFGAWTAITSRKRVERLEAKISADHNKLSVIKTLEFFKSYYEKS